MSQPIAERALSGGRVLRLAYGDLTQEPVDAIVNAANPHLAHGGGVAGAIVARGGKEIQQESDAWVRQHGPVTRERPAITGAGRLPCRFVIHAVGPVWGEGDEEAKLRTAVRSALDLAASRQLTSLALPAISTGVFGFPLERAARVILGAIINFFQSVGETSLREIRVTLFEEATVGIFQDELNRRWPEEPS